MGSYAFTNNSAIQMFSHEKSGGGRFFFLHDHVLRQEWELKRTCMCTSEARSATFEKLTQAEREGKKGVISHFAENNDEVKQGFSILWKISYFSDYIFCSYFVFDFKARSLELRNEVRFSHFITL